MMTKFTKRIGIIGIASIAVIAAVLLLSPNFAAKVFASDNIGAKNAPVQINPQVDALNKAFQDVSTATQPSVVSISVVIENKSQGNRFREEFRDFFEFFGDPHGGGGEEQTFESEASGSGVIISNDGYIITNHHVIDNAKDIKVTTSDKKTHKAELIGSDPLTDLAVLKIEGDGFVAAHFGEIDKVKIGEWVLAIGNPLGLNSTVTAGIVSAIGRGGLSLLRERGAAAIENFIQTDAAINPGNSGGGLFNLEGSLIGINTAIASRTGTYIGYGFAIPVDLVKAVVLDLIDDGKIDRGLIGVTIRSLDEIMAKSLGLEEVAGVLVNDVMPNSAAEKAGLEPGDVILEIDGKKLVESNELQNYVAKKKAGDKVKLLVWRDGKKLTKTATLQSRDDQEVADKGSALPGDNSNDAEKKFDNVGFSVKPIDDEVKDALNVQSGVLITDVKRNSEAWKRGMAPNGVIVKADGKNVKSIKDLKNVFSEKKSGDALMLQVKYADSFRMIAVEIP